MTLCTVLTDTTRHAVLRRQLSFLYCCRPPCSLCHFWELATCQQLQLMTCCSPHWMNTTGNSHTLFPANYLIYWYFTATLTSPLVYLLLQHHIMNLLASQRYDGTHTDLEYCSCASSVDVLALCNALILSYAQSPKLSIDTLYMT